MGRCTVGGWRLLGTKEGEEMVWWVVVGWVECGAGIRSGGAVVRNWGFLVREGDLVVWGLGVCGVVRVRLVRWRR